MTKGIPDGALFEADLGSGVALYDMTHLLPVHSSKRYRTRATPTEVYVHHSGRLGASGFAGMLNSARYVVYHRGWPGMPYHLWIPREPVYNESGASVVFRGQPDTVRTYHAGTGPNDRAIAICLQGNTTSKVPSEFQLWCLGSAINWYREQGILPVFGHCEAGTDGHAKASCPGSHAMTFLQGVRSSFAL